MKKIFHDYINRAALIIAVIGLLILILTNAYVYLHPNNVINMPIQIHSGIIFSEQFETPLSENYEINLTLKISCGLTNDCPNEIPEFGWAVSDSQSVIAADRRTFIKPTAWGGGTTEFWLGTFKAKAGKKYKLEVSSSRDVTAGILPEPKLKISLDHPVSKDRFVTLGLIQFFGLVLLFIGAALFIVIFAFKKLKYVRLN
jgi:hypothetical protein